jgi:hypothetical protein
MSYATFKKLKDNPCCDGGTCHHGKNRPQIQVDTLTPENQQNIPTELVSENDIVKHQLIVGVDDLEKITELRDIHTLLYPLIYLAKLYRNITAYTSNVFSLQNFINLVVLIIVVYFMKYY